MKFKLLRLLPSNFMNEGINLKVASICYGWMYDICDL